MSLKNDRFIRSISMLLLFSAAVAINVNAAEEELADMSDPLAVFTQAGFGFTNKGINLKVGQAYDTGDDTTTGMNVVEIKGIGGELFGWDGSSQRDNSVDSIRYRNFGVDLTNGRGAQFDASYDLDKESGSFTYSLLQALPAMGPITLYPLAGVGIAIANDALEDDGSIDSGYSVPGALAVVGMYSKYAINDKIWLNYNPVWSTSLSGSDLFKDYGFEGDSNVLAHEFAISYQINARSNIRYFANWTENGSYGDGDHRIEYNYQF